jgi:hypothetical protein
LRFAYTFVSAVIVIVHVGARPEQAPLHPVKLARALSAFRIHQWRFGAMDCRVSKIMIRGIRKIPPKSAR